MNKLFQAAWHPIAAALDAVGMYRVVAGSLTALVAIAFVYSVLGLLPYTPVELGFSLIVAVSTALLLNVCIGFVLRIPVNHESAFITALIVFFLVLPAMADDFGGQRYIIAVTALAIVSKYLIVWRKQHLLNPAAAGSVLAALVFAVVPMWGSYESSWWIGTPAMFLPLLIAGIFVVSKVRRWPMVLVFVAASLLVFLFTEWRRGETISEVLPLFFFSGPSVFLALYMLTEPFTQPPTKRLQMLYGAVVGVGMQLTLPFIATTPELALVAGNLLFFGTTLKRKLILELQAVHMIAERTHEFIFAKPAGLTFRAGQYLEWMLPHAATDTRGVRRYFTIASSPTESTLRMALRLPPQRTSTYKQALLKLSPGGRVIASQLAGDFTLPRDASKKLAFIAGGIGITPFRSHLKYLADTQEKRDIVLFYGNNTTAEIAYREEFGEIAKVLPLRVVHVLAKEKPVGEEFEEGFLTEAIIKRRAPDYLERTWYISGPPPMVNAYTALLTKMGVVMKNIKTDFFPGLA